MMKEDADSCGVVLTKNYGAGYTFAMLTAGIAVGFGVLGLL